ncbi:hypothetical protein [Streptomyces sp. SM10]|uniref:hypothetical protein n=1 Tax=Streptomyces sp. SM10 TaxID=565556 RepID=UPI000CD4A995|nr:hypothetical protein [Streptomyces sp. SM10]
MTGRRLVVVGALCVLLAGSGGGWLYLHTDDGPGFCEEMSQDERLRSTLAAEPQDIGDCATLANAIHRATTGDRTGEHSVVQAQAMKNILVALEDTQGPEDERKISSDFAVPFSKTLADYMPDVYESLRPANIEYIRAGRNSEPPWKDDEGVHMSVASDYLVRLMRRLSETPAAYAQLREAVSRQAAGKLTSVPPDADGSRFATETKSAGYVLGVFDALAEHVHRDRGEGWKSLRNLGKISWEDWRTEVFDRLTEDGSAPPSDERDPAGHLTASWRGTLRTAEAENLLSSLGTQITDMVGTAAKSGGLDLNRQVQLTNGAEQFSRMGFKDAEQEFPDR